MFSGTPVLTEMGKTLLLRAAAGESFTFTKFQVGNGELQEGETETQRTALSNIVIDNISIASADTDNVSDGYIQIKGTFDNSSLQNNLEWTELGLIAEDENGDEYLYAYGYERTSAELIRPAGSSVIVEQTITIIVAIGDSENITAYVLPNATYASAAAFNEHVNDYNNPHHLEPETIGAAAEEHTHDADDIKTGMLPPERGGTGVGSLAELSALLEANFKIGFVTGDGKTRKDFNIGFTPARLVLKRVMTGSSSVSTNTFYCEPGKNLYHSGCGETYYTSGTESMLARGHGGAGIIENGFAMGYSSGNRTEFNVSGALYMYIAFKN